MFDEHPEERQNFPNIPRTKHYTITGVNVEGGEQKYVLKVFDKNDRLNKWRGKTQKAPTPQTLDKVILELCKGANYISHTGMIYRLSLTVKNIRDKKVANHLQDIVGNINQILAQYKDSKNAADKATDATQSDSRDEKLPWDAEYPFDNEILDGIQ